MIKRKKLMQKLYQKYPRAIAKKYHDYVGVMVSGNHEEINTIVLCLDLDGYVLKKISLDNLKVDLILSHHPYYYGNKAYIYTHDELKHSWTNKIKEMGCFVVSMHTNFDEGRNGMNDIMVEKLVLKDIYTPLSCPMMRIGYLTDSMTRDEFARYVKDKLNVSYASLMGYGKESISKVGIIAGGGGGMFKYALNEGCDIYISGDAPHHIRRDIANNHFNYLDIPHEVERLFMYKMQEILLGIDPTLNIIIIDQEKEAKIF